MGLGRNLLIILRLKSFNIWSRNHVRSRWRKLHRHILIRILFGVAQLRINLFIAELLIWFEIYTRRLLEIALELRLELRLIWEVQGGLSVRRVMVLNLIVEQEWLVGESLHVTKLERYLVPHINQLSLLLESRLN